MAETMPSTKGGGLFNYNEESVTVTTKAEIQRVDSNSVLEGLDPSQENEDPSRVTLTRSSATVSNRLSTSALWGP